MHYQTTPLAQSNAPNHSSRVQHHHPSQHQAYQNPVNGFVDVYASPYRNIQKGFNHHHYGLSIPNAMHQSTHNAHDKERSASRCTDQIIHQKENTVNQPSKTQELENKLKQYESQQQYYVQLENKIKMLIKENDRLVSVVEQEKSLKTGRLQEIEAELRLLCGENEKLNNIILDMEQKCKSLLKENQMLQERKTQEINGKNSDNEKLTNIIQDMEQQLQCLTKEPISAQKSIDVNNQEESSGNETNDKFNKFSNELIEKDKKIETLNIIIEKLQREVEQYQEITLVNEEKNEYSSKNSFIAKAQVNFQDLSNEQLIQLILQDEIVSGQKRVGISTDVSIDSSSTAEQNKRQHSNNKYLSEQNEDLNNQQLVLRSYILELIQRRGQENVQGVHMADGQNKNLLEELTRLQFENEELKISNKNELDINSILNKNNEDLLKQIEFVSKESMQSVKLLLIDENNIVVEKFLSPKSEISIKIQSNKQIE